MINLDAEEFFEREGLVAYIEAVLTQPGRTGRAWSTYRADDRLRRRLAETIADRADRNYLVAAMAASPLQAQRQVVDPAAPGFDPAFIPFTVGELWNPFWSRCHSSGSPCFGVCSPRWPTPTPRALTTSSGFSSPALRAIQRARRT